MQCQRLGQNAKMKVILYFRNWWFYNEMFPKIFLYKKFWACQNRNRKLRFQFRPSRNWNTNHNFGFLLSKTRFLFSLFWFHINSNLYSFKRTGSENGTKTSRLVYFMVPTVPQNQLKLDKPIFHWWDALEVHLLVFSLRA